MVQEVGEIFSIKVNIIYGQKRDGKNCDCWGRHKKLFFLLSVKKGGRVSANPLNPYQKILRFFFTILDHFLTIFFFKGEVVLSFYIYQMMRKQVRATLFDHSLFYDSLFLKSVVTK